MGEASGQVRGRGDRIREGESVVNVHERPLSRARARVITTAWWVRRHLHRNKMAITFVPTMHFLWHTAQDGDH